MDIITPLCRRCKSPLTPAEAAAYGGTLCETCWVASGPHGSKTEPPHHNVSDRYRNRIPAKNDDDLNLDTDGE